MLEFARAKMIRYEEVMTQAINERQGSPFFVKMLSDEAWQILYCLSASVAIDH